jgi:asparagine synthase (glutamine-hydrolysing)
MCGIAGYFGDLTPQILRWMAATIAHRGPDGKGTWVDADAWIGLAHRHASQKAGAAGSQKPVAAGH